MNTYTYISRLLFVALFVVQLLFSTSIYSQMMNDDSINGNPKMDYLYDSETQEDINLTYNTNLSKQFTDPLVEDFSARKDRQYQMNNTSNLNAKINPQTSQLLQNRSYGSMASINNSNIGEDVSDSILSLSLTARDVIYSLNDKKYFTLTIKNISPSIFTINLAEDVVHNIFLDVYDNIHQAVQIPTSLLLRRNDSVINYRSITLYPNEDFSLEIELNEFVDIPEAGIYRISARFYPDRFVSTSELSNIYASVQKYIESSAVLVSVVSMDSLEDEVALSTKQYTDIYNNAKLITRTYNPYDVVEEALTSLLHNNWNGFFSHISLVKLYTNTNSTRSTFDLLSVQEQQKEISEFMKRLESGHETSDIYPPTSFGINETRYTSYNANVHVNTRIIQNHTTQLFKYNFILEKESGAWKIVNYTVQYIGVESYNTQKAQIGSNAEYVSPTEFR